MRNETGTFDSADGHPLFEQHWLPDGAPRADLALVHGYAEHSGRYEHVGAALAARGLAVHAFDLRGHGCSGGERVLVRSFDEHLDDLEAFLAGVREPDRPLFLLGHSMGGTIAALYAAERTPRLAGVLLSGAVLDTPSGPRALLAQAFVLLGRLAPRLRLNTLDATAVSRDPAVVRAYDSDPLVYRGRMPLGTLSAMLRSVRRIRRHAAQIQCPLLVMHGTADRLVSPGGSRWLHEHAGSRDRALKLYDGLYHEILNEPERDHVLADIAAWLDARLHAT